MQIRLNIGDITYLVNSENNKKLIEFAGLFFDPEITLTEVQDHYIYLREEDVPKLSTKEIQEISDYCTLEKINEFQSYETTMSVSVSMSDDNLRCKNPVQENLENLINKLTNKPKIVA